MSRILGLASVLLVALTTASAAAAVSPRIGRTPVPATQRLARLRHSTRVYSRPNLRSKHAHVLSSVRPLTGERTVLPVLGEATGPRGGVWLHVLLPGRPNGHAGWIARRVTTPLSTKWRIIVALSTRRVTVFRAGREAAVFHAVVGKRSTPTPVGHFFVEETVALGPHTSGAPYALALSARSNALRTFDGGPGQTALHGVENIGGIPGTAVSHGCVRLDTHDITWLATRIGPGVPVTIVP